MTALWLFLAVLGAPLLHAPVLRWNLLAALARPLDGGRCWRGRRLLGDNKTWRGALCMTAGVVLATVALWQWPWWRAQIPDAVSASAMDVSVEAMMAGPLMASCVSALRSRSLATIASMLEPP